MDVNLNNKSMEEYIKKLRIFSKQLLSEGKEYVTDFLEKLISSENKSVELLDFIYKSADDLNEDLVVLFNYLLDHDAELEWFVVSSFIGEETGNIALYQNLIQKCIENDIGIELVRNQIYENCDIEELESFINALLNGRTKETDEESLKVEENRKLQLKIKELSNELELCHNELANERANLDKCGKDLEYFQSQHKKFELKISILERKIIQIEEANVQLQNVNDYLDDEKGKLELGYIQLQEEKTNFEQRLTEIREEYESKLQKKNMRIDELNRTLSDYKEQISMLEERVSVAQTTPVYPDETITDYEEPDIPGIYDEIPQDIFDAVSPDMFTDVLDDVSVNDTETDIEEYFEIGTDIFKNVIEIKDNSKKVVEHTNIFAKVFQWYQKEKFMKKSEQEQKNMIFIEMMKKNFSIELVEIIKKAMVSNSDVSKFDLYVLISRNAAREEIIKLCNGQA